MPISRAASPASSALTATVQAAADQPELPSLPAKSTGEPLGQLLAEDTMLRALPRALWRERMTLLSTAENHLALAGLSKAAPEPGSLQALHENLLNLVIYQEWLLGHLTDVNAENCYIRAATAIEAVLSLDERQARQENPQWLDRTIEVLTWLPYDIQTIGRPQLGKIPHRQHPDVLGAVRSLLLHPYWHEVVGDLPIPGLLVKLSLSPLIGELLGPPNRSTVTVGANEKTRSGTGVPPEPSVVLSPQPDVLTNVIIIIDRRDLIRSSLASWLGSFGDEFQTLAVADIETVVNNDPLKQAAIVLFGLDRAETADRWLCRQIEWLRERRPDVPIALLLEDADVDRSEMLVSTLAVQGCIPTSTSLKVATAALHLIAAGGSYFPTLSHLARSPELVSMGPAGPIAAGQGFAKLTPREEVVLSVLAGGAANKLIAHRLGISMSTVKAHVHSIIGKLRVRNRTEAVVAAGGSDERTRLSLKPRLPKHDHGESATRLGPASE